MRHERMLLRGTAAHVPLPPQDYINFIGDSSYGNTDYAFSDNVITGAPDISPRRLFLEGSRATSCRQRG